MAGLVYISETRPDLLDDICNEHYTAVAAKLLETNLKELIVKKGANLSHAEPLVIDLSAINDTVDEIAEAIISFKHFYPNKRTVIIADKENANSEIFKRLFEIGVYNIAVNLEYETLKKCLFEDMTKDDISMFIAENSNIAVGNIVDTVEKKTDISETAPAMQEKITANREFKKHKEHIFVAICGTERHIGATHQALLITKFLSGVGFKACYLEANKRRNIGYIADIYTVNANENKHLIQFEGFDMYYDQKLSEIIKEQYDFIIFDFGDFSEIETPAVFLTKDIKIIVGGVKAWEMPVYTEILNKIAGSRGINFIVNFAPPFEFEEVKKSMSVWNVYFSEYAPYPFSGRVNIDIYKEIFCDYLTVESVQAFEFSEKKRKKLFKFWG